MGPAGPDLPKENHLRYLRCGEHPGYQGDGTAAIFVGDPTVFTLSVHARRNFPWRKVPSDRDVELEDGVADDE